MHKQFHRFLKLSNLTPVLLIVSLVGLSACENRLPELPSLSLTRDKPAPLENAPLREARALLPASGKVIVQAGDTIFSLATRYQITPQSIINDNQLVPPFNIAVGEQLSLSPARYHIVVIEDNLYDLSQRYAVSQRQIAALNELQEPYDLLVGQRLLLPDQLDFSVLDVAGIDIEAVPASAIRAVPQTTAATPPKSPPKSFVAPALGGAGFTWPVKGEVVAEFGPLARGVHNDGVNIRADEGTLVVTSAPGTVAFVGTGLKSFGNLVLVKHEGGYITAYAHLSDIQVKEGDVLGEGRSIGQVGMTGRVDSPQLHFEIRQSRTPLNPREIIS